jgi:lysophospholipase L1-like esterase
VKVGSLVSNTVTVTLTINRPPVASGGCKNTAWNTPVSIDLKPLVSDADNSIAPANFAITVQGTKGTASPPDANGMVTYVPSGSTVTGADSFTYQYTDPAGAPATGQVKVAIGNRIMPVGDSVTAGIWTGLAPSASDRTGYRRKLYADLTSGGKNTISFVGQYLEGCTAGILDIHCGNTSDPAMEGAHHDGTRGLQDDTLKSSGTVPDGNNDNSTNDDGDIVDRLNLNPADIVLIHIGTNGIDGTDTTVDAASIVTNIRNWEANNRPVTVLFARIISSPNSTYAANANTRNNTAEADLRARSDFGGEIGVDTLDRSKRLFLVDMQAAAPNGAGLSYVIDTTDPYTSGDMYDDFHPNSNGYDKMADAWRNALTSIGLACP